MPRKIIGLVLMGILFPVVVFASPNVNTVPGFADLTWGESLNSVSQKYGLSRMNRPGYDRNISMYNVHLSNAYIYDIKVLPEIYLFFINDKLYSLSGKFTNYANDRDYNQAKNILISKLGEPDIVNNDTRYEYASWNTEVCSITLSAIGISAVNRELSPEVEKSTKKAREREVAQIDWDKYAQ